MKKCCFFPLLLLPLVLTGQKQHEIKADFYPAIQRMAFVSYELVATPHFGLEIGLGHRWGDIGFTNSNSPQQEYYSFDRNSIQAQLAGKFYISKNAQGDRWFLAPYFLYERQTSLAPDYATAYREKLGRTPTLDRNIRGGLGGSAGFKRVYKNRLLIELGIGFDVNLLELTKADRIIDIGSNLQLKLGYRLGKKVEEKE